MRWAQRAQDPAYLRTYHPSVTPGRGPLQVLLALLLAASPVPVRADFDGRAGAAAVPVPFVPPFVPAPAPRLAPMPAAAPAVFFKGRSFPAVQFGRERSLAATLVEALDLTQRTALLALYELKLPAAADAVIRAHRRGVAVRVVFDEGHARENPGPEAGRSVELQRVIDAGVEVRTLRGGGDYGIMHHKTAVLDGELVVAGSFNWTLAAEQRHYENLALRDDPAVVALFDADFRWMWEAARPIKAPGEAGSSGMGDPPADSARPVRFNGGAYPRAAFSPRGGIEALLLDAIGRAKRRADVAMFSFYSEPLARALIDAKARGVKVSVVADAGQARRSPAIRLLRDAGVPLRLSAGREQGFSVMHHKYIVLDGRLAVNGSYNFSRNAELNNHENVLFSADAGEAGALLNEQEHVFSRGRVPDAADLPPLQ
jgi:phosphatidylserine/phosphatidylglycerophosphate/cardiolipin synthase-like enzyme